MIISIMRYTTVHCTNSIGEISRFKVDHGSDSGKKG